MSIFLTCHFIGSANIRIKRASLFDVEEIPTHGGSLRIYARHPENESLPVTENVAKLIQKEKDHGITNIETYQNFQARAECIKLELLTFLIQAKKQGKKVAAYGAAAKGKHVVELLRNKSRSD